MKKIASKFYNKFKKTPIPVQKIPHIYNSFHSVSITFHDGSIFAVPYFFYQQAKIDDPIDFQGLFLKELPWIDLVSNIFELATSKKTKITPADVKILKALTYYKKNGLFNELDFINQKNFLFPLKKLVSITNVSMKWISERLSYLQNNYVLYQYYILNPFIFGLKTYLLLYDKNIDENLSYLNQISLFKLNLSYNEVIRIIQIPNIHASDEFNFPFSVEIKEINEMQISNNLHGLHDDYSKSFNQIPNFDMIKNRINKDLIEFKESNFDFFKYFDFNYDDGDSQFYTSLKKMSPLRRTSIFVRILNYLAKWGSLQENLKIASHELRINPVEFLESCRFLFNNDIIAFFPRITRIGCNNRYGILALDQTGDKSEKLNELYNNLLELPHSIIFFGKGFLFSYVSIPDSFVIDFLNYMNYIKESIDVKHAQFTALKSWGRFSIPLPEGTTVDEFGVNFPSDVIEKLQSNVS